MPTFNHQPVLLEAVIAALQPKPGGFYVDGTVGSGGHSEAILKASAPTGRLCGFDRDAEALAAAAERLAPYEDRVELHQANFADMPRWVDVGQSDGVVLDLGVSSHQLDTAARGFSFQQDGKLDMRMDAQQSLTAADLLDRASDAELARIFRAYGDEPQARRFARAIVRERERERFETTGQLAQFIERLAPRYGKKRHPATRVFMALRMAVNQETDSLECGLAAACSRLKAGGRLAVISFHSVEDRIVKQFGNNAARDYTVPGTVDVPALRQPCEPTLRWVHRKPIVPDQAECAANPRARSAKLRVMERL